MAVRVPRDIYEYLRTTAGSADANVNGVITPVTFKYVPTKECEIGRMLVQIKDGGGVFVADNYGSIVGPLANGVLVQVRDIAGDVVIKDLCGGLPMKSNGQWARVCFDTEPTTFGAGDNYWDVRWTFTQSTKPLFLYVGEQLEIVIQDNLLALSGHNFFVMGQERE